MKSEKILFWLPRILSILYICFLALFSFDVLEMEGDWLGKMIGFLIHNIPSIFLAIVLLLAWRCEWVGAIIFLFVGCLYIFFASLNAPNISMAIIWSLSIAGPAFLIGISFLICRLKRKELSQ